VCDDGAGAADTAGGFGLLGLRERVQILDGRLTIHTAPGQGFALEVELPL
jgi:signal transduction histidine kinase